MSEDNSDSQGNFNEDELKDIMSEIESLEQDFSAADDPVKEEAIAEAETSVETAEAPELEEGDAEMIAASEDDAPEEVKETQEAMDFEEDKDLNLEADESLRVDPKDVAVTAFQESADQKIDEILEEENESAEVIEITKAPKENSATQQCLGLEIEGTFQLNLKVGGTIGEVISISIDDGVLKVESDSGAQMSFPLQKKVA